MGLTPACTRAGNNAAKVVSKAVVISAMGKSSKDTTAVGTAVTSRVSGAVIGGQFM